MSKGLAKALLNSPRRCMRLPEQPRRSKFSTVRSFLRPVVFHQCGGIATIRQHRPIGSRKCSALRDRQPSGIVSIHRSSMKASLNRSNAKPSTTMRKIKSPRRPTLPLFLGQKLVSELRILMRLASSANGRSLPSLEEKAVKSF